MSAFMLLVLFALPIQTHLDFLTQAVIDRHNAMRAGLHSIQFREKVVTSLEREPVYDVRSEMEALDRHERGVQVLQDDLRRQGAADSVVEAARKNIEQARLPQIERAPLLSTLQSNAEFSRVAARDLAGGRAHVNEADLRDVAAIAAEHQLSESERATVSRTGRRIVTAEGTMRIQDAERIAVRIPVRLSDVQQWRALGRLSPRILEHRLVRRPSDDARSVIFDVYDRGDASVRLFDVELDPTRDSVVTRMRTYNAAGDMVNRFQAMDYRRVDGYWIPFQTVDDRAKKGVVKLSREARQVEAVEINPRIDASAFAVPESYHLIDPMQQATRLPQP